LRRSGIDYAASSHYRRHRTLRRSPGKITEPLDILDTISNDEESSELPTEPPTTMEPSHEPTSSEPTESPTDAFQRFVCAEEEEDEPFERNYCDEDEYWNWYETANRCDSKCKGRKICRSVVCSPTASPTLPMTASPTSPPPTSSSPTSSSPTSASPTSSAPTSLSPTSSSPSTAAPVTNSHTTSSLIVADDSNGEGSKVAAEPDAVAEAESVVTTVATDSSMDSPKFEFSLPESEESPTKSTPLTPFQLDLIVKQGRKLHWQSNNNSGRKLQDVFQSTQDGELQVLVSSHLLQQFEKNLEGNPTDVVLGIEGKSEGSIIDTSEVGVSYSFIGYVVYAVSDDATSLPTTADLDAQVLHAFNSRKGKKEWMNALEYSEDEVLKREVVGVAASIASPIIESELESSHAQQSENSNVGSSAVANASDGGKDSEGGMPLAVPLVIAIVAACATSLFVIGLLSYRKYKRYQENNARNEYLSYQHKKRKITINTKSKKLKQYDHFESPEGSVASHDGKDLMYDLEIVGGDTFPMSQEYSEGDPQSPASCKKFDPENPESPLAPYDEKDDARRTAAYDMAYFDSAADQITDQSRIDDAATLEGNETLEGLYSDKDSYFQSTVGGQHRRGESIHSLETLDNTFTSFGLFGNESMSHYIDGIEGVMTDKNDPNSNASPPPTEGHIVDLEKPSASSSVGEHLSNLKGILNEDIITETTKSILESSMISKCEKINDVESTPFFSNKQKNIKSNDDIIKWRYDNDLTNVLSSNVESNEGEDQGKSDVNNVEEQNGTGNAEFVQSEAENDASEISTTDELYARISELEKKILNTETQLARDQSIHLESPSKMVSDLPRKMEPTTSEGPNVAKTTAAIEFSSSSTIKQQGMLSNQTLEMIEQTRLSGTPPPSEGEVDGEMIRDAKENSLLGKLGDSDSEEDTVFEG